MSYSRPGSCQCVRFSCPPGRCDSSRRCCAGRRGGGRRGARQPRVNIHIPWNLKAGDCTWVGEEVCIINFALTALRPIAACPNAVVSALAIMITGQTRYRHAPILRTASGSGSRLCRAGRNHRRRCGITAMSLVSHSVAGGMISTRANLAGSGGVGLRRPCRRTKAARPPQANAAGPAGKVGPSRSCRRPRSGRPRTSR